MSRQRMRKRKYGVINTARVDRGNDFRGGGRDNGWQEFLESVLHIVGRGLSG